jgi:YesN/AraC family two-component response regulator
MKVLLADDQVSIHKFLEHVIDWKSFGFSKVLHAYDGQETLELLEKETPDLLLLDIEMPVLSGVDVMKKVYLYDNLSVFILSAYDEFKYAQVAIETGAKGYLLKPIDQTELEEELKKVVQSIQFTIRNKFKVIVSQFIQEQDKGKLLSILSNEWEKHIGGNSEVCFFGLRVSKLQNQKIIDVCNSTEKGLSVIPVCELISNSNIQCVFVCIDYMTAKLTQKWIVEVVEKDLSKQAKMGVSSIHKGFKYLQTSIHESELALKMGFYNKRELNVFSNGNYDFKKMDEQSFVQVKRDLFSELKIGVNVNQAKDIVNKFFYEIKEKKVEVKEVLNIVNQILYLLNQAHPSAFSKLHINNWPLNDLDKFHDFEEISDWLMTVLTELFRLLNANPSSNYERLNDIKKYAEDNFNKEISLQIVAAEFHMDKYQLSRLFKKYFEVNFWTYVTTLRMKYAEELLMMTDLKVNQISERVGYLEESHFSHAFKKHFGKSPMNYKQSKSID